MEEQLRLIKISLTDINDEEIIRNKPTIAQYLEKNVPFTKDNAMRAIEIIYKKVIDTMVVDKRSGSVNWLGVTAVGEGGNAAWSIRPLGTYLYDGLAGLALFFAAFGKVSDSEQAKKILHAVMNYFLEKEILARNVSADSWERHRSYTRILFSTNCQEKLCFYSMHKSIFLLWLSW